MTGFCVGSGEKSSSREEEGGGGRLREVTSLSPDGLQSLQSGHGQATVQSTRLSFSSETAVLLQDCPVYCSVM